MVAVMTRNGGKRRLLGDSHVLYSCLGDGYMGIFAL